MADNDRTNILFIITDAQRGDCLSRLGHPTIQTPNLDRLAAKGVLFSSAYVQCPVCGPSRMSLHTGRYVHAHRSSWNEVPLPADEGTTGTYFSEAGYRAAWMSKTHYVKDYFTDPPPEDQPFETIGQWCTEPMRGFEDWAYDRFRPGQPYRAYLEAQGYPERVFTTGFGSIVSTPTGELLDPNDYRASRFPTVVRAEDSRTAFFANRAMDFIREASGGDRPWLLALNYFSPHHPWVAPAPYHAMYDPDQVPPPNRHPDELKNPHPMHKLYRIESGSPPLDDEEYCRLVRAVYYGMVSEIDHHVGRLLDFLEEQGLLDSTIIVFTSDHGVFLGDHWMRETELWFDESHRVPLIIYDPSSDADGTRGQIQDALVEEIDILPTLMDAAGLELPYQIQGRSLMPMIREGVVPARWRTEVHSDWDFRFFWVSRELGLRPEQCRMWMIRDREFKYVHFNALPELLYDLQEDPQEWYNLARDSEYRGVIERYRVKLLDWRMSTEDNSRIGWTYQRRPRFGLNPFRLRSPWPPYL